jgi:hypothetical protein
VHVRRICVRGSANPSEGEGETLGDFRLDIEGRSNWILSGLGDVDRGALNRIAVGESRTSGVRIRRGSDVEIK